MHDLKLVRERPEVLREAMRRRGALEALAPQLDRCETLEKDRRLLQQAVDERKAARNASSQEVARRKKAGEPADDLIAQGRALGEEIARLDRELADAQHELDDILARIPNVTLPDVPEGGEECNVIVRSWGEPRPSDGVRPHWEIAAAQGLFDIERGAKVSGSGFVVYRGRGARLVRALMNLFLDSHAGEHGYEEVWPPAVVNRASMTGTGQLPKMEDDAYRIAEDDLFLIPTAEVPVTNLYRGEEIPAAMLPMGFCAYSPCFRREAGAAGKDTRGILRMHQFDKVELVRYCTPEDSAAQLELLLGHAEAMLRRLGLPYRVKLLAAGDTGFSSAKTYDLEAWAPGVGAWLEVSSCSTFTDFQARRANIKYRPAPREGLRLVHTLNGSGLAFPRVMATLLEHYQQADGSVLVPDALRPYLGTDRLG
ncbi:MAG: serine--tRNA ligase [Gemmatimonadaceae bacterium]|nr:serine--tRNA ligase [Gemmatimonadaceae bacterium]NUO94884.1 serine--tRNA ligase [Gemmatimonadaceae bacterium]NUP56507.1 serine--tRNA ligase [Gemmatimonadaceae bacterium]NUP71171.1 serine--tRNA ligase [Gemmatimonadaceae bacterium]NUR35081.1 serine--tRNA ligase [Gemmatimonadaceae bacterium]